MNAETKPSYKPNLAFNHFGIATSDLEGMIDFYTRILGFTVTDRGSDPCGLELVFLSRDPGDHHQLLLVNGRPDNIPPNPFFERCGSVINQISFKLNTFAGLRELYDILLKENVKHVFPSEHAIAWSVYAHDPDGNNLEFFVDTPWYVTQPFLVPIDMSKSDEEIIAETEARARTMPGFQPYSEWRKTMNGVMTKYDPEAA